MALSNWDEFVNRSKEFIRTPLGKGVAVGTAAFAAISAYSKIRDHFAVSWNTVLEIDLTSIHLLKVGESYTQRDRERFIHREREIERFIHT